MISQSPCGSLHVSHAAAPAAEGLAVSISTGSSCRGPAPQLWRIHPPSALLVWMNSLFPDPASCPAPLSLSSPRTAKSALPRASWPGSQPTAPPPFWAGKCLTPPPPKSLTCSALTKAAVRSGSLSFSCMLQMASNASVITACTARTAANSLLWASLRVLRITWILWVQCSRAFRDAEQPPGTKSLRSWTQAYASQLG